jgi:hypothetical protein
LSNGIETGACRLFIIWKEFGRSMAFCTISRCRRVVREWPVNTGAELPEEGFEMTGKTKSETRGSQVLPAVLANMTQQQLAALGEGQIAYLKPMLSEDIRKAFPQAPQLAPGLKLFALFGADGMPILLADSRAAALANAWENELQTVSLH